MYDGREAASSTDFRKSTGISSGHKRIGGPAARAARKPSMLAKDGAILGVHPKVFSPTSVQFKSEINDAFPRKRHQKRHLEFCTAHLLSRMAQVRVLPGASSPTSDRNRPCRRVSAESVSHADAERWDAPWDLPQASEWPSPRFLQQRPRCEPLPWAFWPSKKAHGRKPAQPGPGADLALQSAARSHGPCWFRNLSGFAKASAVWLPARARENNRH